MESGYTFEITVVWNNRGLKCKEHKAKLNQHCPKCSLTRAVVWVTSVWDNESELYSKTALWEINHVTVIGRYLLWRSYRSGSFHCILTSLQQSLLRVIKSGCCREATLYLTFVACSLPSAKGPLLRQEWLSNVSNLSHSNKTVYSGSDNDSYLTINIMTIYGFPDGNYNIWPNSSSCFPNTIGRVTQKRDITRTRIKKDPDQPGNLAEGLSSLT